MGLKDCLRLLRVVFLHIRSWRVQDVSVPIGPIVIFAPHPDDEVIGCGGLMQRLRREDREIHLIIMTGGEGSHHGCCNIDIETLKNARRGLSKQIDSSLGIKEENIHFLNFPDGNICYEHPETESLKSLLNELQPGMVLVPHWGEGWPDHVNASEMVKQMVGPKVEVFEYCVWMWYYNVRHLDWKNARILRMTEEECHQKQKAIDDYTMPKAPCGKPWSGVLPELFLKAAKWRNELFFRAK